MKKSNKRLAPNGMQNRISLQIRRDIRAGVYEIGEKLPSRVEFEQRYGASPVTVQKAFDKLKADNYIYSCRPKGTFVRDRPPCFYNYGLVFSQYSDELKNRVDLYGELYHLAKCFRGENISFKLYTGLNGHVDEPDYIKLYEDVKSDCLAGIIFATDPFLLKKTSLFKTIVQRRYLPKVAFMSSSRYSDISAIDIRNDIDVVFEFLEHRGVKSLAVIAYQETESELATGELSYEAEVFRQAESRGIDLPRYNFQVRHPSLAFRAGDLSRILLKDDAGSRPQALWIMNDAFVESATKAVSESGVKVPEELLVISYCNFPEKPKSYVDTFWYGIDVNEFISLAVDIIVKKNKGQVVKDCYLLETKYNF